MNERKSEIVITGVNGFVGEHLAKHLKGSNFLVHGVGREEAAGNNVASYLDSYERADLMDADQTRRLRLKDATAIIHLAGLASVSDSFKNPELYKKGNASITDNLLSSAKEQGFSGRVVAISSGALYDPSSPQPLTETSPTQESSPYAYGKLRAEEVVQKYKQAGLDVVIVRPFNHIGPGQGPGFLVPDLYLEIKKAEAENRKTLSVGNLKTKRDYTDVRDIVRAYTDLATASVLRHTIYNVASGKSYSGLQIFDYLKTAMDVTEVEPVIDPERVRPTDAEEIVGDASLLRSELGWQPNSSVKQAIQDFVDRNNL